MLLSTYELLDLQPVMPKFARGVIEFQRDVFPAKQELFERLSHGQEPEALFISCSDARIETAMLTQSDPGELFICRNPGNIVPPHSNQTGGTATSIEFAISILNVPHIVLCGHTECAAMKAALAPGALPEGSHLQNWLGYTRAAAEVVNEIGSDLSPPERQRLMLEQNVILQLAHLKTHPSVAVAMAKGTVTLHGWIYDIRTGDVSVYNAADDRFEALEVFYADAIAAEQDS